MIPKYSEQHGYEEYADAQEIGPVIDMHTAVRHGDLPKGVDVLTASDVNKGMMDIQSWLPYAAEEYNISAKLEDFVIVPVTIFFSDMPNANMAAFPLRELSKWNSSAGKIAYKSWEGKPTFLEHANSDPSLASGVIFAAALRKVPEYQGGFYRQVLLSGWDRTRNALLTAEIESKPTGFSMGAWVTDYNCSVCNGSMRAGGCRHLDSTGSIKVQAERNQLVYRNAKNITGFELSKVAVPAWRAAVARPIG